MNDLKVKTETGLVKRLRSIRDKMNEDMQDMTFDEVKAYLKKLKEGDLSKKKIKSRQLPHLHPFTL